MNKDSGVAQAVPPAGLTSNRVWLLVALVLIMLNLRPAISAVSALLGAIRSDLGLSGAAVSVLTALPTVGLAVFAFLGPRLTGRWGEERLIAGSGFLLLAGNLLRMVPAAAALFGGTALIGSAIGLVTGAIPGLVKRAFPDKFAALMALYTITLTIGASVASGFATPLAHGLDSAWTLPLAVLTVPIGVLACLCWTPALTRSGRSRTNTPIPPGMWRDRVAWQVTIFFSCTGFIYYFVFSWLPTVCHDRGMDATASGFVLSVVALVQVVGSLGVPAVIARTRDQRGLSVVVAVVNIVGLVGVTVGPVPWGVWVSAVVLGLSLGGAFGLAMTLIGLRAQDAVTATGLSGMTQGIGYAVSAAGPLFTGLLHSATGGWLAPLGLVVLVCLGQLTSGLEAGRTRTVLADVPQ
ncbi:CynX/NimT family MFS transporter [Actinocrispum wychmicini]|uniref:CP family cyanate transporter-like MFS transporter n=1 Tax=Actinocrispum wychmicini TaxID=1213861 RepID=A0A4R2JI34_9PSEU|nr:MFS transporter [Actinocrispum wychmicini]TCO56079.1 CP family cyanate transporter-like MFS transporter [Actinocrispum wychmicini]